MSFLDFCFDWTIIGGSRNKGFCQLVFSRKKGDVTMKKRYLLVSMMIMAAVALVGCGGNSTSKAGTSVVSESTESTADSSSDSTEASSKDTETDTKTKDTTAKDTTAEEPSDPDADSSASMESSGTADSSAEDAKAYIGVSMDEFKSAFGQPNSSSAADSDNGKAGTYTYDTFTVTTHTDADGNEVVDSVE